MNNVRRFVSLSETNTIKNDKEIVNNVRQLQRRPKTFDEYNRERISVTITIKQFEDIMKNYNPATHVIVTKAELDVANQIKLLVGMASTLQDVKEDVQFVKSVYTINNKPKSEKAVTSKEERSIARKAKLLKVPRFKK